MTGESIPISYLVEVVFPERRPTRYIGRLVEGSSGRLFLRIPPLGLVEVGPEDVVAIRKVVVETEAERRRLRDDLRRAGTEP